jgi:CRISPR-associated protein Cmr3
LNLKKLIGYGDDLGDLSIQGVWLSQNGRRLYPAPRYLVRNESKFDRLEIGFPARSFLGERVRLPQLPVGRAGFKPLENVWLTQGGVEKVLDGDNLEAGDIFEKKALYTEEPRLGVARNNNQRVVEIGLLYQCRHIRPIQKNNLTIEVDISGMDEVSINGRVVRLGGEGRLAGIEKVDSQPLPRHPVAEGNTHGLILTLLTPARFNGSSWLPKGFLRQIDGNGAHSWKGEINNVPLTIHCAVIGKAQREGGWDMTAHAPRAVQSLIPAGSAWYCTVDDHDLNRAIEALHGRKIGEDQQLGRGLIACGLWNDEKMNS